jgi:hypothetical protein
LLPSEEANDLIESLETPDLCVDCASGEMNLQQSDDEGIHEA